MPRKNELCTFCQEPIDEIENRAYLRLPWQKGRMIYPFCNQDGCHIADDLDQLLTDLNVDHEILTPEELEEFQELHWRCS